MARDYRDASLDAADRVMLDYAVKLTLTPWEFGKADIDKLREVGFDDTGVLDICQVTSYYNYVNRLADGLGVELETEWKRGPLTLTRAEFEEQRRDDGSGDEGSRADARGAGE